MEPTEKARFDSLYQTHLRALKLRGFSENTIDVYSRAVDSLKTFANRRFIILVHHTKTTQEPKSTAAFPNTTIVAPIN